jgi:hypothetical protein
MKRGGLAVAVILLVTGALRWASPGGSPGGTRQEAAGAKPAGEKSSETKGSSQSASSPHGPYASELEGTIRAFYGVEQEIPVTSLGGIKPKNNKALLERLFHWNVPQEQRRDLRFLIALLPDPVHTQLGLSFDRAIETIEKAAQEQDYDFDRATMPWDSAQHSESRDFQKREQEAEKKAKREEFPGLIIFRPSVDPATHKHKGALFVFVVSETPTGGVNKQQFARALDVICQIKDICKDVQATRVARIGLKTLPLRAPASEEDPEPLMILGPAASGSLYSLQKILDLNQKLIGGRRVFVFSGTQRATDPRLWFEARKGKNVRFVPFQDGERHVVQKFVEFAVCRGYKPQEIAVLSEDETAYGRTPYPPTASENKSPSDSLDCKKLTEDSSKTQFTPPLTILFPRGISQFRAAYQKQVAQTGQSDASESRRPVLPLDLTASGSDDDSVASYATTQSPLSQEAVMLGIVSRLHQHRPKFVILRASDPVDELFLLRYLRQGYPQGRVVVTAPDLLFAREDDGLLHGVLAIGAFSLAPGIDRFLTQAMDVQLPHSRHVFPSGSDAGAYNALIALLAIQDDPDLGNALFRDPPPPDLLDLPLAPYADYGSFRDWRQTCSPATGVGQFHGNCRDDALAPGLSISILGHAGFWLAHAYPGDHTGELHEINADVSRLPSPAPQTPIIWTFAYSFTLLLLFFHCYLIYTGSILSGSEIKARFSVIEEPSWNRPTLRQIWQRGRRKYTKLRSHLTGDHPSSPGSAALLLVAILYAFRPVSRWKAGPLHHRKLRARLVAYGTASLATIALLLVGTRYALKGGHESMLWTIVFVLIPLAFTFAVSWHIHWKRGEPEVAWVLFGGISFLGLDTFLPLTGPTSLITSLTAYRDIHLGSGVSPLLPILFLIAALYCMAWYELHALAVTDCRSPQLPSRRQLANNFPRVSEDDVASLRSIAKSFSVPKRVFLPILCLIPILLVVVDDWRHPIQTIEGTSYDWFYALLLLLWLMLFLGCLSRLVVIWDECRRFLGGLDALPLRDAFKNLKDFSWNMVWSPSGSALRDSFKFVSREIENLRHLQKAILALPKKEGETEVPPGMAAIAAADVEKAIFTTMDVLEMVQQRYQVLLKQPDGTWRAALRQNLLRLTRLQRPAKKSEKPEAAPESTKDKTANDNNEKFTDGTAALMSGFATLQHQLGKMASVVMLKLLAPSWSKVISPVASRVPSDIVEKKTACQLVAEEFVALIYASFLASVLLRMRSLVMEAIGIYVCLVLSISCYPFEPNPAMFTLAVILIVVSGVIIGYVYSQMHCDPALSRLTSTAEGERGLEFWMQLLGAAAVPVLSLLAVQFPAISHILMGWLQPALQATK